MNRFFAGVAMALMTLVINTPAFADDTDSHEIKFDFNSSDSLSHWLGVDGSSASTPQLYEAPVAAHGNESGYLLLNSRKQESWMLRDQFFDSLGMARLVPQGSFMAGGVTTRWYFSAPDDDTLLLRFVARF